MSASQHIRRCLLSAVVCLGSAQLSVAQPAIEKLEPSVVAALPPGTRQVVTSRDGRVWAATSLGISRYNHSKFEAVTIPLSGAKLADSDEVIAPDNGDGLYVATDLGLLRLDQRDPTRFLRWSREEGLPADSVDAVHYEDGVLFFVSGNRFGVLRSATSEPVILAPEIPFTSESRASAILLDDDRNVRIRTTDRSAFKLDLTSAKFVLDVPVIQRDPEIQVASVRSTAPMNSIRVPVQDRTTQTTDDDRLSFVTDNVVTDPFRNRHWTLASDTVPPRLSFTRPEVAKNYVPGQGLVADASLVLTQSLVTTKSVDAPRELLAFADPLSVAPIVMARVAPSPKPVRISSIKRSAPIEPPAPSPKRESVVTPRNEWQIASGPGLRTAPEAAREARTPRWPMALMLLLSITALAFSEFYRERVPETTYNSNDLAALARALEREAGDRFQLETPEHSFLLETAETLHKRAV